MAVSTNYGSGIFPSGTDFPFVSPSSDVRGLFEDLFMSFDNRNDYEYPLKITQVTGFQTATPGVGNLVIRDQANTLVFDTSTATSSSYRSWGATRVIYIWEKNNIYLTAVRYYGAGDKSSSFSPSNGDLDERAYQKECFKVNNIRIGNTAYIGNISLIAGYNMVFTLRPSEDVEGKRKVNRIQVGAVAGEGTGIYPLCPEDCVKDSVTTVNGTEPDYNGNLLMVGKECYWFGIDGESDSTRYRPFDDNTLNLNNNCLPCCECNDYVYTYRAIQNLYSNFKALGDRAMAVRTQHYANHERWLAGKSCRESSSMRIYALPIAGGKASVLVTYCNTTNNYIGPIKLEVTMDANGKSSSLQSDSVVWYPSNNSSPISIDPEGEWPAYVFRWDNLSPGKSAKIRFVVEVTEGNSSDYLLINAQTVYDTQTGDIIASATPYSIGLKD